MERQAADVPAKSSQRDHSAEATVVVPVYKTELYLPACLDSLLSQTHSNFDIIVVDDCSPGHCRSLARSYQEKCNRIRYVRHEENKGLLCARLTGVSCSLSKYIAFLDSDDTAKQEFLATLIRTAEETGADIVGSARFKREVDEFTIDGSPEISSALCTRRISNHNAWTKLFRRSLFENSPELMIFGANEHIVSVEDVVITLTLCTKAARFVQIGKVLVNYNKLRPDSSWNSVDNASTMKSIQEIARVFTYIEGLRLNAWNCLGREILGYFYKKKFLKTDAYTQEEVIKYIQLSPVAKDLRAAIVRTGSIFFQAHESLTINIEAD